MKPLMHKDNVDTVEIAKFSEHAGNWWDPEGDFKPLHLINPLRLKFINDRAALPGKAVIDIGCGAGIPNRKHVFARGERDRGGYECFRHQCRPPAPA